MPQPIVLIADHSPGAADLMKAVVELAGFRVVVAANGKSALQLAADRPPVMAIIDLDLPDMSGYEVATRLHPVLESQRPYLIAISAHDPDPEHLLAVGFDEYFAKPVNMLALRARLDMLKTRLSGPDRADVGPLDVDDRDGDDFGAED